MSSENRPETGSSTLPLITLSIRRLSPACTIVTSVSAVSFWKGSYNLRLDRRSAVKCSPTACANG